MTSYFLRTSDSDRVIRIPSNEQDGPPELVNADEGPRDFNLTNTLKTSAVNEARAEAKAYGLRLRNLDVMGVLVEALR